MKICLQIVLFLGIRKAIYPECDKEDYSPEGKPLYKIVDGFADDQGKWFEEFVPSLEKMVENGYTNNDLVDAPNNWFSSFQ